MKKIYFLMICALMSLAASAVPAKKGLRTVKQSDGTELQIQLIGDEYFSYHATADGVPVVETLTGSYVYASIREGAKIPTATLAHNEALRSGAELQLVNDLKKEKVTISAEALEIRRQNNLHTQRRAQAMRTQEMQYAIEGNKHCLIVLVQYPDKQMVHTQAEFQEMASEPNYSKHNHVGSLSDFFYDQSYGKLNVEFDVVGPFMLDHEMSYYGEHYTPAGSTQEVNDHRPGAMISEAVHKAKAAGVNFAKYDWTGDGYVDQVFVIFAGYAEAQGGKAETIWPHKWSLHAAQVTGRGGDGVIQYDGVKIDTYACSSELRGAAGTDICGIGTAAHEFSHCLGLPDLYDTDYSGGTGMSYWSLMCDGNYRADGDIPAPYTAQERSYIGWIKLIELDRPMKVKDMPSIIDEPVAYVVYNEGYKKEYYILENHQTTITSKVYHNWDRSAPGHGMLVTHVDFDANAWSSNTPNDNPNHQRCIFIGADGKTSASGGSLYPGSRYNTALTNTTNPAATTYNKNKDGQKFMNKPIESITEHSRMIDFIFDGGVYVPTPELGEATDVTSTSFTANWSEVAEADSYTLEVTEKGEAGLLFMEDFATDEKFNVSKDGTDDIASKLDDYLYNKGWKGKELYVSAQKIKMGQSTTAGYLQTSLYTAPTDGFLRLEVGEKKVTMSNAKLVVSILDKGGKELASQTISPDNSRHTLEFSDITKDFSVRFATDKNRLYINYVAGYTAPEAPDTMWNSLGKGLYSDIYMFGEMNIPCEFFQHKAKKSVYRIQNPYVEMLNAYHEDVSPDASDYLYLELLKKGDEELDQKIDRDDLVLFYGPYDYNALNTGYTLSNYAEDVCLLFPGVFKSYSEVSSWASSRVMTKNSDGTPKRIHLAPFYYLFNASGGWDATQEKDSVVYVDFPSAQASSPVMTNKLSKGMLRYRALTDKKLQDFVAKQMTKRNNIIDRHRKVGDKSIITDITGTSYSMTGLTENVVYAYRVKAVNGDGDSKWSEYAEVDLSKGTGIQSVPASKLAQDGVIYDLSGRRVERLHHGIYIQNGKAIIVK